jgi:hypothetical protein
MKIEKYELFSFKTSKKEFEKSFEAVVQAVNNGWEIGDRDIIRILTYARDKFVPMVTKPANFKSWLLAATSKEDGKEAFHHVFYNHEMNETVATDGKRLHLVKGNPLSLPYGLPYMSRAGEKCEVKNIGPYPTYHRVIPENPPEITITGAEFGMFEKTRTVRLRVQEWADNKVKGFTLDNQYFEQAVSIMEGDSKWFCHYKLNHNVIGVPILCKGIDKFGNELTAALMPMRIGKNN